jgi:hypothetical protein
MLLFSPHVSTQSLNKVRVHLLSFILAFILECPGDTRRAGATDPLAEKPEPLGEEPVSPPADLTPTPGEFDSGRQDIDPERAYGEVVQDLIDQGVLTPSGSVP